MLDDTVGGGEMGKWTMMESRIKFCMANEDANEIGTTKSSTALTTTASMTVGGSNEGGGGGTGGWKQGP